MNTIYTWTPLVSILLMALAALMVENTYALLLIVSVLYMLGFIVRIEIDLRRAREQAEESYAKFKQTREEYKHPMSKE